MPGTRLAALHEQVMSYKRFLVEHKQGLLLQWQRKVICYPCLKWLQQFSFGLDNRGGNSLIPTLMTSSPRSLEKLA